MLLCLKVEGLCVLLVLGQLFFSIFDLVYLGVKELYMYPFKSYYFFVWSAQHFSLSTSLLKKMEKGIIKKNIILKLFFNYALTHRHPSSDCINYSPLYAKPIHYTMQKTIPHFIATRGFIHWKLVFSCFLVPLTKLRFLGQILWFFPWDLAYFKPSLLPEHTSTYTHICLIIATTFFNFSMLYGYATCMINQ